MAHTKPKSMKVTRTKVRKRISRIEANDAFVFLTMRDAAQGRVYLNIGGKVFWLLSETPIRIQP